MTATMVKLILWIVTPDKELSNSWYNLFSRETFQTVQLLRLSTLNLPDDSWGLIFAEIGAEGMAAPNELRTLLAGRKNVSVIVFSRPGKTSNALISGFLESGADDFITNDIDEKVLLSKTKAHIRRLLPSLNAARTILISRDGDIEIDRLKRTVKTAFRSKKEKVIESLTPKEFDIFSLLLCKEAEVVSRSFLMEELWKERSGDVNFETIDKHVETLRRKLGPYGRNIRTIYGTGYTYKSE